jgi:hypothetical protein
VIDFGLVAVAVAVAERVPGRQLLRAHPLAVIQVVYVAVERRLCHALQVRSRRAVAEDEDQRP